MTPLWCSAVANKVEVVKSLLRHGANVNACSDTNSTPVRSACYMTNLDVSNKYSSDFYFPLMAWVILGQAFHIAILSKSVNLHCKYFEVKPKSEEIVHFYLTFCSFQCVYYLNCHVLF